MNDVVCPSRAARSSLVLIGLAWTLPFLQPHHHYPLTAFYGEWLAFALGLAACWPLLTAAAWRDASLPPLALALLGFVLLLAVHAAAGRAPYAGQALVAALYVIWAVLLVLLGRWLRTACGLTAIADVLAWSLLAGGVASALIGFVQLYGGPEFAASFVARRDADAVFGNLAQRNHFAAYVTMAVASAGYLCARGKVPPGAAAGVLCPLLLVLAASGSRSVWLFLTAQAALAVLLYRRGGSDAQRRLLRWSLWMLPCFVAAQWGASLPLLQPDLPVTTSARRLFEAAGGIEARLQLALEAWRMFLSAPVFGAGWGQFAWHHFLYLGETGADAAPGICNHAHNIVLHLLAETGALGAILVTGALIWWFVELRRLPASPELWWVGALALVLGIHSLLEYPLWYAYFLGVAALLGGVTCGAGVPLRRARLARAVVVLCAGAGAIHLAAVPGPYRAFERLVFDREQRGIQAMDDAALVAAIERIRREPVLEPYVDLVTAHGIVVSRDQLTEKLALNTRVLHFAPVNVIAVRQALLLALAGEQEAAQRQLAHALRAYPAERDDAMRELSLLVPEHPVPLGPLLEFTARR